MKKLLLAAAIALAPIGALAQSSPHLSQGQVLTAGQWNQLFINKQDTLGFLPLATTGGVMTGELTTAPSSASVAGLNIPPGIAPSAPVNGDFWSTSAGFFGRVNGATVGPFAPASSAAFAATAPLAVTFPSSVVTYSLNFNSSLALDGGSPNSLGINLSHSNAFSAAQTINLNATALTALTGTVLNLGQANAAVARVQLNSFGSIAAFTGAAYGGTGASPAAVTSGTELVGFNAFAYNGASLVGPISSFRSYAAENIASGHQGSKACIATTPIVSTTLADGLCQNNDAGVTIGSPTGGSQGAGSINVTALYINGVSGGGTGAAGTLLQGNGTSVASTYTATPTLGIAGSVVGSLSFANLTSGTIKLATPTGALGSAVLTLPAVTDTLVGVAATQALTNKTVNGLTINTTTGTLALANSSTFTTVGAFAGTFTFSATSNATIPAGTHTLAGLDVAQSWAAVQSFGDGNLAVNGLTSGALTIKCAATCGTNTITFPAGTTNFSATGGTSQVLKQVTAGAAITVGQLAASDLSNGTTGSGAVVLASAPSIANLALTGTVTGNNTIPYSILAQATGGLSVLGVTGAATANIAAIQGTASQFFGVNAAGTALAFQTLAGDATLSGPTITLGANVVSNAKFRQSVALSVVGNATNALANVADITGTANQVLVVNSGGTALAFGQLNIGSSAAVTGTLLAAQEPAHTGDVTNTAGSLALTISPNAVTYAKFQQVAASSLVGNAIGSLANATGITLGSTLAFSGSALQTGAISGDVTSLANSFVTTLATVNSNVGSFGSSTAIPVLTVNGKGLITAASTAAVIAPAGTLTGTTLASNVVTSSLTSVGTLAGLTVTGSFTATGLVTNANLVNASTTVNGQTCTLGSTCTISASAGSVTIGTTTITSGATNSILYQNGASPSGTVGEIATANNGVLITSGTGAPSISSTLPTAVQSNIVQLGTQTAALAMGGQNITGAGAITSSTLNATSSNLGTVLTATWNGTAVGMAYGGTGAALTASNGGVVYSSGTAFAILSGTVTAGQCLLSGSSAAPTWGSCSGGGAAVSSVAAGDTTLTISPTTGSVVAALNLSNANSWAGIQTFAASGVRILGSSTGYQTLATANASASNFVTTFPAITDTVVTLTATQTLTNKSIAASQITGQSAVANGGTGVATLTNHGVLIGQGTGNVAVTTAGSAGQVLTSNGASADPTFQTASGTAYSLLQTSGSISSGAANVAFTGITANDVILYVKGVTGSTNSMFTIAFSIDNGSTWTTTPLAVTGNTLGTARYFHIGVAGVGSGLLQITNYGSVFGTIPATSASKDNLFTGGSGSVASGGAMGAPVNGIRLIPASGTFSAGTIELWAR